MKKIFLVVIVAHLLFGCTKQEHTFEVLSDTTREALTPALGKDEEGRPFVWWIEKNSEGKNMVKYALSKNGTIAFEKPREIKATEGCNDGHGQGMPRMIFKKDGTMIVVYHVKYPTPENRFAGKIFYTQSFDRGKQWTVPALLHSDTLQDNGHAFPALTLLPDGEVSAVWLDGRNHLGYSEVYTTVTEGKKGFGPDRKIGGAACQCCKLEYRTGPDNQVHVLYRAIIDDNIRDIVHISSKDNGKTFSEPVVISNDRWKIDGCPHQGPGMTFQGDSIAYIWYTMGGGEGIFYCSSDKEGKMFSLRQNLGKGRGPSITGDNDKVMLGWEENLSQENRKLSRIRMQVRENGKIKTRYITSENEIAFHPCIVMVSGSEVLVAYQREEKDKKQQVGYKILSTSDF